MAGNVSVVDDRSSDVNDAVGIWRLVSDPQRISLTVALSPFMKNLGPAYRENRLLLIPVAKWKFTQC
jgi:hypothetical protein